MGWVALVLVGHRRDEGAAIMIMLILIIAAGVLLGLALFQNFGGILRVVFVLIAIVLVFYWLS